MNGLWDKIEMKLFNQYGLIGLIAVAGIYFGAVVVRGEIDKQRQELQAHSAVTSASAASLALFTIEQKQLSREMYGLLRAICLNTARTDEQRTRCIE